MFPLKIELKTSFLESNPGLKSRFNKFIHFEDYTAPEMVRIFEHMLDKADYRASPNRRARNCSPLSLPTLSAPPRRFNVAEI
jgi:hypothetical protein